MPACGGLHKNVQATLACITCLVTANSSNMSMQVHNGTVEFAMATIIAWGNSKQNSVFVDVLALTAGLKGTIAQGFSMVPRYKGTNESRQNNR